MNNIWSVILAAGASTRMGTQKLLLPFQGSTMIEKVIESATAVVNTNIVIVLGAQHTEIRKQINNPDLIYIINDNYSSGMLTSVICGFRALPEDATAVLLFLGDQPQIPQDIAQKVISSWQESGKGIVIPAFSGKRGHPVLIETRYKKQIEELDPEQGLRMLSQKFADDVFEVECGIPEILRDIDTPEDYEFEISKMK